MNVKDLSILFKHVNFEEDKEVKNQMLQIIKQYLNKANTDTSNVFESDSALSSVEEVKNEELVVEEEVVEKPAVKEKVVEPEVVHVQTEEVVVIPSAEPETAVETVQEELVLDENEENSPVEENNVETTEVEKQEVVESQEDLSSVEEAVIQEEDIPEKEAENNESAVYTESFSILATTNDQQLEQLKQEGGYIFREKRTFMLGLCVGNEWIALAKTTKFEELPSDVQEHLKQGEFVAVKIRSVGESVKKSRANFRDIEFYGFELLPTDHQVKIDVLNLIDYGIIPESKKAELEQAKEKEATVAPVEEPVVENPVVEQPQQETFKHVVKLGDEFVNSFANNREMALQMTYPFTVKDGLGTLKFNHPNGVYNIGQTKTEFLSGEYVVKFADYSMDSNIMNAEVMIVSKSVEEPTVEEPKVETPAPVEEQNETTQEAAPAVEEVKTPSKRSELVQLGVQDAPADFPNTNVLTVDLLPLAAEKLDRNALNKNDKPFNLLVKDNKINLVYDIFTIGEATETLSTELVPDMKLLIRAAKIDVEDKDGVTSITYTFDQMAQVEKYPTEQNATPISEYIPLTEENFIIIQQQRSQKDTPKDTPKTPQEIIEPKGLQPGQVEKMTNPNGPVQDLGKSVEQLVPRKEVSESVKALQNKPYNKDIVTNVMNNAKSALSTMVAEASTKTKVHLDAPEKQETVIQGNLKEGVGELTETETVVNFVSNYSMDSWRRALGRRMTLKSEFSFASGQDTSKTITVIGKDGSIVAQGQVPVTAAMFLDGNCHSAELLAVESAVQLEEGFSVSIRLGKFEKIS